MNPEKLLYLSRDPGRDLMDRMVDWAFFNQLEEYKQAGAKAIFRPKAPLSWALPPTPAGLRFSPSTIF